MSSPYQLVVPTSVEPLLNGKYGGSYKTGWIENSRPVFKLSNVNKEIRPKTTRINGILQTVILVQDPNVEPQPANWRATTSADKVYLDPNAGVNGFFYIINTKFKKSSVESITDYAKFVAMKNEAKYFQIDHATSTDSMLELMTFSNDAKADDQIKYNANTGLLFPMDADTSEKPFSVDLDFCLNGSDEAIPYSRTGDIELELILSPVENSGLIYKGPGDTSKIQLGYVLKNLEVRFLADDEQKHDGAILLETKSNSHIPTIQNRTASVEHTPSHAYDSIVCSLRKAGNSDNFTNSYLQSVELTELVDFIEVKVNGRDGDIEFPLKYLTVEMLYNYLLAWNPYIHEYSDTSVRKHGLSYSKLSNDTPNTLEKSGWGIGCTLHGGVDAGTRITFNMTLKQVPASPYQCFMYTLGRLVI